MLWQESFPFPCFDPFATNPLEAGSCSSSASEFAAVLAIPDFVRMIESMLEDDERPLLDAGSTRGVRSPDPPLNMIYGPREDRLKAGHFFSFRNDSSMAFLLQAWEDFRPDLLSVLIDPAGCSECGGQNVREEGKIVFYPDVKPLYNRDEITHDLMRHRSNAKYQTLGNLLYEKCFCFFTEYTTASVPSDPFERWRGPIPPVRELQELAYSDYAFISRKIKNLPALYPEVLELLCNISKGDPSTSNDRSGDNVLTDVCQEVTFLYDEVNRTINTCNLTWDVRMLETTVASCIAANYLAPELFKVPGESWLGHTAQYTYNTTVEVSCCLQSSYLLFRLARHF